MQTGKILTTPSYLVSEYFETLRRYCQRLSVEFAPDSNQARQDTAVCIALAIQCIEVFFNVYFRRLTEVERFQHLRDELLAKLGNGLDQKAKEWPRLLFGREIAKTHGIGKRLDDLRIKRNSLMHFKHQNESIELAGVSFRGLSNTVVYDSLRAQDAYDALDTVESYVLEIFKLQGIPDAKLPLQMRRWTGKWPCA